MCRRFIASRSAAPPGREAITFPLEMQEQLISSTSSSEDENDVHQLTINEHCAKASQYRKEREELAKRVRHHPFSSIVSGLSDFFLCSQGEIWP